MIKKKEKEKDDKMEIDDNDNDNSSKRKMYEIDISAKDVGNVFDDTTIFFEYNIRKDRRNEFKSKKKLPFQVHIHYNKMDGTKMLRVITQQKGITFDKKKLRENLDFKILSKYGTRVTTKLCGVGDYEASRAWTQANVRYMHNNVNNDDQLYHVAHHVNKNVALDYQMQQQQQQEVMQFNNNNNNNNGWSIKNIFGAKNNKNNNQQIADEMDDDVDEDEDEDDNNNNNMNTWSWRGSNNNNTRKTKRR
eukprot:170073_1